MFAFLFRRSVNDPVIERLYAQIVGAARHRVLFTDYGVEDTVEGRFETFALLASLVLRRLKAMAAPGPDIAQDLADAIFRHFDAALRESGVGDVAVPKRMKAIAESLAGRALAYDQALRAGGPALGAALSRNVYADRRDAGRLTRFVEAAAEALHETPLSAFTHGPVPFPDPAAVQ
jgi:cytochrome b pre-mRNA-processing protein 3